MTSTTRLLADHRAEVTAEKGTVHEHIRLIRRRWNCTDPQCNKDFLCYHIPPSHRYHKLNTQDLNRWGRNILEGSADVDTAPPWLYAVFVERKKEAKQRSKHPVSTATMAAITATATSEAPLQQTFAQMAQMMMMNQMNQMIQAQQSTAPGRSDPLATQLLASMAQGAFGFNTSRSSGDSVSNSHSLPYNHSRARYRSPSFADELLLSLLQRNLADITLTVFKLNPRRYRLLLLSYTRLNKSKFLNLTLLRELSLLRQSPNVYSRPSSPLGPTVSISD